MIITLTPNLSLDRTLQLESALTPGQLHRVASVRETAGGKGVNVARVIKALGGESLVTGFLAGWNGRKFRDSLEQEGLAGVFEGVEGETRECHIILGGAGHPTEINERGPSVSQTAWQTLLGRLPEQQLVICGSLPPGLLGKAFADLLASLAVPPVVDTSGEALATALECQVALIKPNRQELSALTGVPDAGVPEARHLYERYGTPILFTMGAEGAAYVGERCVVAQAPEVDVVNPVGSGDSLLGAFLWARAQGATLEDALCYGVAAGSDNAKRGGGRVTLEGVEHLRQHAKCHGV